MNGYSNQKDFRGDKVGKLLKIKSCPDPDIVQVTYPNAWIIELTHRHWLTQTINQSPATSSRVDSTRERCLNDEKIEPTHLDYKDYPLKSSVPETKREDISKGNSGRRRRFRTTYQILGYL